MGKGKSDIKNRKGSIHTQIKEKKDNETKTTVKIKETKTEINYKIITNKEENLEGLKVFDDKKFNIPKDSQKDNILPKKQKNYLQKDQKQKEIKWKVPKNLNEIESDKIKNEKEELNSSLVDKIIGKIKKTRELNGKSNKKFLTIKEFEKSLEDFKANIQELLGKEFSEAQKKGFEELKSFKEKYENQKTSLISENQYLKDLLIVLLSNPAFSKELYNLDQIKIEPTT